MLKNESKFTLTVILIASFFELSSCIQNENDKCINFEIKSPKSDWTYYSTEPIIFASSLDNDSLEWESSLDGKLGSGPQISVCLSSGEHLITLSLLEQEISKCVKVIVIQGQNENVFYVTYVPCKKTIKKEACTTGIINTGEKITEFNFSFLTDSVNKFLSCESEFLIDPSIWCDNINYAKLKPYNEISLNRSIIEPILGNRKLFYIADTTGSSSNASSINAVLYYSSDNICAWVPEDLTEDEYSYIDICLENLETIALPRTKTLWGSCADINGDKKIAILFSHTINEEGIALGFFNSADFFTRNVDKSSSHYNPFSNECDIIYAAIPESLDEGSFSASAITATLIHEITHAINFTNKTYNKLLLGKSELVEEIFLNEGLSHLSESLCGYGVSGGNNRFVNYYLNNMAYFSFAGNDYLGRTDSAGCRGATCLFLYWLFLKAGGMSYDESNPINFMDKGGISFLQSLVASESTGWNSIGEYFKKDTDFLFKEFCVELFNKGTAALFDQKLRDPTTGEFVFPCNEPELYSSTKEYSVLSKSAIFFTDIPSSDITMNANKFTPFYFLYK